MVLIHTYECSFCRTMKNKKEDIKYCGGCKVMGYCSKECQRQDWKEHKFDCKGVLTGKRAISRNPVIKIAERIAGDDNIMAQVDCFLITVLDLIHHPENADTYGVAIAAHVEFTDMKATKIHIEALLAGREPPKLPPMIPKLFQVTKAVRIEPNVMPATMEKDATERIQKLRDDGSLRKEDILVRALWVEGENTIDSHATMFFYRVIAKEQIEQVAKWRDDEGQPMTTDTFILEFNRLNYVDAERKKKMSTMVPSSTFDE